MELFDLHRSSLCLLTSQLYLTPLISRKDNLLSDYDCDIGGGGVGVVGRADRAYTRSTDAREDNQIHQ